MKDKHIELHGIRKVLASVLLIGLTGSGLTFAADETAAQSSAGLLKDCSKPFSLYPSTAEIDPELLPILGIIAKSRDLDLPRRERYREGIYKVVKATRPPFPEDVTVEEISIPGPEGSPNIRALMYTPVGDRKMRPALLDIHGGSWVIGFPEMNEFRNYNLANDLGAVVVSIDYRLAPENPFPAALDDSYAALKWLHSNAETLGIDPNKIAVSGDSAGGSIAGGLALYARDKTDIPISFQVLVYPALDDRAGTTLDPSCAPGTGRQPSKNIYLDKVPDQTNVSPYAFPARAKSLENLPPTFIGVGDIDPLIDQSISYAQRLINDGVPTELHIYPGAIHGFDMSSEAQVSKSFYNDLKEALKKAWK